MPALRQQPDGDPLVDDVVFGEQDAQRRDRRVRSRRVSRPASAARDLRRRDRARGRIGVEQIGVLDRLGEVRRDAQLAAARRLRRDWPDELSIMIVAPASSGLRGNLLGDLEAVEVRHVDVEQHQDERACPRCAAVDSASSAARAAVDGGRLHLPARQLLVQDAAVDALSSTISTGRSASSGSVGGSRLARSSADVERAR